MIEVMEDGDRVVHQLDGDLEPGSEVDGEIDWPRRFDHMQQHTGQHLLSAVVWNRWKWETVGFHMGKETSTVDFAVPNIAQEQLEEAEVLINASVVDNLPVSVRYQNAETVERLRKISERTGMLRLVEIAGLDLSACGGTHVRATGEIGSILLRTAEKLRGNTRVIFLCGSRAVAQCRRDQNALRNVARIFSSALDDVALTAARQSERLQEAEKGRLKAELAAAAHRGRELYRSADPVPSGLRFHQASVDELSDLVRMAAQSFVSGPLAAYLATATDPPSVLLAVSEDSGLHAGNLMKEALVIHGGRGGGAKTIAQGSLPGNDALQATSAYLLSRLS